MSVNQIELPAGRLGVWPQGQGFDRWVEPSVILTRFADIEAYHPALVRRVLELESDPELSPETSKIIGGSKVYHLERWNAPEALLIQARAVELYKRVFGRAQVFVDLSWATIYRSGDYCMPHSHFRTKASLVYFLDLGDGDPGDSKSGAFLFVDPRFAVCCRNEPGRMTTPCAPELEAGTLIMFPGQIVHYVNPYTGRRPRITLSWNINDTPVEGSPLEVPEDSAKPGPGRYPSGA